MDITCFVLSHSGVSSNRIHAMNHFERTPHPSIRNTSRFLSRKIFKQTLALLPELPEAAGGLHHFRCELETGPTAGRLRAAFFSAGLVHQAPPLSSARLGACPMLHACLV